MIHIYYGDGKGKTTSAVGLAIRSSGCGKSVLFTQFLKSDDCSERRILECIPNLTLPPLPAKTKFVFDLTPEEHNQHKAVALDLFNYIKENIKNYDLIVADEIFSAVDVGFLTLSHIKALINAMPKDKELVLTGHNVDKSILIYSDYVTYMSKVKHPFDLGVSARLGVEY